MHAMQSPKTEEAQDGLEMLAHALYLFLQEVDGYRAVCVKHDATTELFRARNDTVWLKKSYEETPDLLDQLTRTVERLEGWETSIWKHDLRQWKAMDKRIARESSLILRGVTYEGRPMLVRVCRKDNVLEIHLAIIAVWLPGGDFPMRAVSEGLSFYEMLMPGYFGKPRGVSRLKTGDYPIHAYLKRTMPRDSQIRASVDTWPKAE